MGQLVVIENQLAHLSSQLSFLIGLVAVYVIVSLVDRGWSLVERWRARDEM